MPDKMIAIEINGNQHYERDGTLKPYYQERHNLLESKGWIVYEIHYSSCFNLEKWVDFVNCIRDIDTKVNFDYFNYKPKVNNPKLKEKKCECGEYISNVSTHCRNVFQENPK